MRLLTILSALVALQGASCPGPTPEPPVVTSPDAGMGPDGGLLDARRSDGSDGDIFDVACLHLVALGCKEGDREVCPTVMRNATQRHFINYHPECVAASYSKEAVRACGPEIKCE